MVKRFLYLAFCVILILFLPIVFVASIRDLAVRTVRPAGSFLMHQNLALGNFVRSIAQISSLREDKRQLQEKVVTLEQSLADRENVLRENAALREELGVIGTTRDYKKVFAHVIIQGNDRLDPTVTVDAGTKQDLAIGQPAVYQGALIGKVISVRENSAVIRLITSKESVVQAWLIDNREKGRIVGDGTTAYLSDITQGIEVKEGMIAETSGLGGSLPQGILIGDVSTMQSKKSDLSQKFLLKLPHDPSSVESVFILLTDAQ